MLKKQVSKVFEYPDMNATITVRAFIHKISYRDVQEKKNKAINFLKSVNKEDMEALIDAFEAGNLGRIMSNINDPTAFSNLLGNLEENIRLCVKDTLEVEVKDNDGVKNICGIDAEGYMYEDSEKWLGRECSKVNPELFHSGIIEEKKKN